MNYIVVTDTKINLNILFKCYLQIKDKLIVRLTNSMNKNIVDHSIAVVCKT